MAQSSGVADEAAHTNGLIIDPGPYGSQARMAMLELYFLSALADVLS